MNVVAAYALLVLFLTHATCLWLGNALGRRHSSRDLFEVTVERNHYRRLYRNLSRQAEELRANLVDQADKLQSDLLTVTEQISRTSAVQDAPDHTAQQE